MSLQEISIEITQKCPNNCKHCSSFSSWNAKHMIPYELVQKTVKDAVTLGAKTICLSGGEPFLHPKIVDIARDIYELNAKCIIYSSGIYFDNKKYQSIPNELLLKIKKYTSKIIINYEASKEKSYDMIMGTSVHGYRIMRRTIKAMLNLGIKVETHVVPMKLNIRELQAIIKQCNQLGVKRISFLRLVEQGRAQDNIDKLLLSENELATVKEKISAFAQNSSIRIGIPLRDCAKRINCMTGTSKLNIRYDGFVYPCEAFKNDLPTNFTIAKPDNIYQKSLEIIYRESPYLHEIRERLQKFQLIHTCENCMNQYYRKELSK